MRLRLALAAVFILAACGRPGSPSSADAASPASEPDTWKDFSGERAMTHVRAMVAIGPRPSGSPALEACRGYLEQELRGAGWETRRQTFEDDTPQGRITFHNIRARLAGPDAWSRPVLTVVGSHYDTKWFQGVTFVGANDAGSSTGLLVEMARAAAAAPVFARSLELVFFDGEEAFVNFTARDGLYGSRHYARDLRTWPDAARPRFGVIFDMVGDADLRIEIPANTSSAMRAKIFDAAENLGFGKHFGLNPQEILDDHVPLGMAGLEVTNFIDFTYAPWHTAGDTLDKLSPASLEITGRTGLLFLQRRLP